MKTTAHGTEISAGLIIMFYIQGIDAAVDPHFPPAPTTRYRRKKTNPLITRVGPSHTKTCQML